MALGGNGSPEVPAPRSRSSKGEFHQKSCEASTAHLGHFAPRVDTKKAHRKLLFSLENIRKTTLKQLLRPIKPKEKQ